MPKSKKFGKLFCLYGKVMHAALIVIRYCKMTNSKTSKCLRLKKTIIFVPLIAIMEIESSFIKLSVGLLSRILFK